jgi:hypothetical protein
MTEDTQILELTKRVADVVRDNDLERYARIAALKMAIELLQIDPALVLRTASAKS